MILILLVMLEYKEEILISFYIVFEWCKDCEILLRKTKGSWSEKGCKYKYDFMSINMFLFVKEGDFF